MARKTSGAAAHPSPTKPIKQIAAPQAAPAPEPQQEEAPAEQSLLVPCSLILAAETVSSREETRPYLNGVYIHTKDRRGRVIGCDGHRLFVSSFDLHEQDDVEWASAGVILSAEFLKARVSMIQKVGGQLLRLTGTKGNGKLTMSDMTDCASFKQPVVDGTYPDYERVIPSKAFSNIDEESGELIHGKEWEPVGINSSYLKHIGEVAKVLDNGLDKSARTKGGTVVRAFNGGGATEEPLVFDFSNQPGALLVLMPVKTSKAIAPATAALLDGPIKLTIAALRAHATRNKAWAAEAPTEGLKQNFLDAAERFEVRIAGILEKVPGYAALGAPETEAKQTQPMPDPVAEPVAEPEPTPAEPDVIDALAQAFVTAMADDLTVEPDHDQDEPEATAPVTKTKRKRSVH